MTLTLGMAFLVALALLAAGFTVGLVTGAILASQGDPAERSEP